MSPTTRRSVSRVARIAVPVVILGVILFAVSTTAFVQLSSQPWFCGSCHIMKPYYASWTQSSHRHVACIQCHIAPGIKAEAMTKIQAANMVVKDFTGTANTRPWAKIDDAGCLRSGCHSTRLIEGQVEFKGVRFDHTKHLGEVRRGIQLHCTSCHSQIVQGSHIAVTETTCILCHFKGRPEGKPLATCAGCHPTPPRVTSKQGYAVDHAQYVKDRVDCGSCHSAVTQGTGEADAARCVSCHNEPAKLARFKDAPLLHTVHVGRENIACVQCHTSMDHRMVSITTPVELDCKSCHASTHSAQQKLFAGVGGHATPNAPSSMFQARVSCIGCHNNASQKLGHDTVQVADESACLSCHGVRYANILPSWQRSLSRKLNLVEPVVRQAREAATALPMRERSIADSLLGMAADNVGLVRTGKGVHNIVYADQLLRSSLALVRQSVSDAHLAYHVPAVDLGPPVSDNSCLQCHMGVEQQRGTLDGRSFDHAPHVTRGALQCTACHTSLAEHGGTTVKSAASCDACHHPQVQASGRNCAQCHAGPGGAPAATLRVSTRNFDHAPHLSAKLECAACHKAPDMSARAVSCDGCHHQAVNGQMGNCASCHRGPGGAPAETMHMPTGDFAHRPHTAAKLECATCHKPGALSARALNCDGCHANHHRPEVACISCHRSGALAKHKATDHVACAQCHKTLTAVDHWSRNVCTSCHVAQTNHRPGPACESCHQVPPMGAAKSAAPGRPILREPHSFMDGPVVNRFR